MSTKMDEQAEALAKEAIVLKLFRLYRSMDGKDKRTLAALTETYLEPVMDYSTDAVRQAYERFRVDEVDGADPDWLPTVPRWVGQVKMLDGVLKRYRRGDDGLIVYRIGELPPPGYEPLGPIKLEVDGRDRDVSHLTLIEKEEVLRTGKLPESQPTRIGGKAMRQM